MVPDDAFSFSEAIWGDEATGETWVLMDSEEAAE